MKLHFRNILETKRFSGNRNFWKVVQPFLRNKESQLGQSLIRTFISFVMWTCILLFQKSKTAMQITLVL